MANNQGMWAISMMVKLSEDIGLSTPPTDKLLGLSASCLFLGQPSDNKYVKLEWNFEKPVNLIDWIGLFQQDQCNPLLYMDYKGYGVCGSKAGSVNWKITNAHLNAVNNSSLCFRYYNGLTGALRASSPPLLVYSDAQIAITSIVCKQLPESKSVSYYAKISSSVSGCQYKTPFSSNGCWRGMNYLFSADKSSELKFSIKERTNHWPKSSCTRVLGVVNIAVLDVVQSANQDLAFVLRPLASSSRIHSPAHQTIAVNHCQIVVSCRLQPQQQQSYHDTLTSLGMPQATMDLNSFNNNRKKPSATYTKISANRASCMVNNKNSALIEAQKSESLKGSKNKQELTSLCSNSMVSSESSENTTSPSSTCFDTLPSSASLSPNQPSTSSSNSLSSISNLPPGWEVRVHRNGRLIYIDHINKRTTWHAPVILESYMSNGNDEDAENKQYICARRTVIYNEENVKNISGQRSHQQSLCPTDKLNKKNYRSEQVFVTKPKAVKFLQRQDFSRLLFENEKALHLYNESTYLKHIIQRIRHDPAKFEVFEGNRELVEFINLFADRTQPLPAGWQAARHTGTINMEQKLFIDHRSRKITLIDPRLPEEIKQRRTRSAPPTRRMKLDASNDLNGNAIWDVVNRADEIQTFLAERLPEIAPKVCKKLKIISRVGEAALVRFANDMDLITAISVLDQTTKPTSTNEFEKKLSYFYSSLQRAGYGQGPGKIRFRLRRSQLMNDAYEKILAVDPIHLKKYHMTVTFDEEDGLDYGGPSRELFFLLSRELFNPYYGLFEYSANDTYTVQMSPMSKFVDNHLQWMELCGRILGLALIHRCLIDTFFTRAFYKYLLRLPYTIQDLQSMDQQFYSSLNWMRENRITPDLELTFNATEEVAGEVVEKELLPGGKHIAVTEYNKEEYISLLLKWRMESSVEEQGRALLRGLHSIIDKDYLRVFDAEQLELVLSGTVEIDIEDWQENTEYKGYYEGHVVVHWFWQTVYCMCNAERLKLLQFVTGTSSIPFEGFRALRGSNGLKRFTIEKWGNEDSLPRAHTCFNRLDLPAYPTQQILLNKLKLAINESSCYAIE